MKREKREKKKRIRYLGKISFCHAVVLDGAPQLGEAKTPGNSEKEKKKKTLLDVVCTIWRIKVGARSSAVHKTVWIFPL